MKRWLVLVVASGFLAGCQEARWGPSETTLRQADFKPRDQFAAPPPIYCYRTLGKVDCLATPAAEPSRLIGAYQAAK
jgi:hypothetical protein